MERYLELKMPIFVTYLHITYQRLFVGIEPRIKLILLSQIFRCKLKFVRKFSVLKSDGKVRLKVLFGPKRILVALDTNNVSITYTYTHIIFLLYNNI
jgi:hypothetical protein